MLHRHHAVIIGGGFGGLYAAKELGGKKFIEVTLIDKRNFHLFQPLLYQVATGGLSPGDISSPLRAVLNRFKNVHVMCDEMVDLDPFNKTVICKNDRIQYDSLIIATGVCHSYFGNPDWAKQAPGLKSIEDALEIRRKIFSAFEEAEIETDNDRRKSLLTFVIIGGGPTGVELAGALAELAHNTMKGDFRNIDPRETEIVLLEAGSRLLPGYPHTLSQKAALKLHRLGVTVKTGAMVKQMNQLRISYEQNGNTHSLTAQTILWAAGVIASSASELVKTRCRIIPEHNGKIPVKQDLTLDGFADIFVLGDLAYFKDKDGNPLPGVSSVAMQQGRYAARSLIRRIQGKAIMPFRYLDKGSLAVIGRNAAVANFRFFRLDGILAWIIWVFVHIRYLIEFDNKLLVMTQWAWNYFTRKRGARLITEPWNKTDQLTEKKNIRAVS